MSISVNCKLMPLTKGSLLSMWERLSSRDQRIAVFVRQLSWLESHSHMKFMLS